MQYQVIEKKDTKSNEYVPRVREIGKIAVGYTIAVVLSPITHGISLMCPDLSVIYPRKFSCWGYWLRAY
jgi:hypothetical protein